MSSPNGVCASHDFRFPETNDTPDDRSIPKVKEGKNGFDYDIKVSKSQVQEHGTHSSLNSSISSLSSEATICENSPCFSMKRSARSEKNKSTETLVDERGGFFKKAATSVSMDGGKPANNSLDLKSSQTVANGIQALLDSQMNRDDRISTPQHSSKPSDDLNKVPERLSNIGRLATSNSFMGSSDSSYKLLRPDVMKRPSSVGDCKALMEELKRRYSENLHSVSIKDAADSIHNSKRIRDLELPDVLILDLRPSTDYANSRLKGSINVCLSLTLLKRSNYTLNRCINSLPLSERLIFQLYTARGERKPNIVSNEITNDTRLPKVLLYDTFPNSFALYYMAKKFMIDPEWKNSDVCVLNSRFYEFEQTCNDLLEYGPKETSQAEQKCDHLKKGLKLNFNSPSDISSLSIDTSTPILSNFVLPKTPKKTFKIRHTEEILTTDLSSSTHFDFFNNKKLLGSYSPCLQNAMPNWIKSTLRDPQKVADDFHNLELSEKERLLSALSLKQDNLLHDTNSLLESEPDVPKVSHGIEYGHKNRYKDIFLYEHSRVKLNDLPDITKKSQLCDYINASYIRPEKQLLQRICLDSIEPYVSYIATQGPLQETTGDFWKLILNHKSPLIISLTDEMENGAMKCFPFWLPNTYRSNENTIRVELVESYTSSDTSALTIRRFRVTMDDSIEQEVLQLHLLKWQDMCSILNPDDLISVIYIKYHMLKQLQISSDYPTVIHCSAGCGRTGTLCAIDTILGIIFDNGNPNLLVDPIHSIVDNFRKQRVSMVQTLGQYFLIYETVLAYLLVRIKYLAESEKQWRGLFLSDIVQNFIKCSNH